MHSPKLSKIYSQVSLEFDILKQSKRFLGGILISMAWCNTLFLQNWCFYEFFSRDRPYIFQAKISLSCMNGALSFKNGL